MVKDDFINKVEESGIVTVDLIDFAPEQWPVVLDIKDLLFQGLIVREKEFKASLLNIDWENFRNKPVVVGCSVDAIIPPWAYMMVASRLHNVASYIDFGTIEQLELLLWKKNIEVADFDHLAGKKVVVRARADIDPSLYLMITRKLKSLVKTLMYGEAGLPKVIWKE